LGITRPEFSTPSVTSSTIATKSWRSSAKKNWPAANGSAFPIPTTAQIPAIALENRWRDENESEIIAPAKMPLPHLQPRVKESDAPAGDFVTCGDAIAFGVVANRAGQAEVFQRGGAVQSARDNVLRFKRLRAEVLLQSAVLTQVPRTPSHISAKPR